MGNPYKRADSFSWGSPPEEKDAPEFWQIDEDCYLSKCCNLPVSSSPTLNNYICECGKFCKINEEQSIEQFYRNVAQEKKDHFND